MSAQEREIHVRLLTGELNGIRIAEFDHDHLQAMLIPRARLSETKQRTDKRLAIYVLIGKLTKPTYYVGKTDDAWERINRHNHDHTARWWKTAAVVVSNKVDGLTIADGFSLDDITWLESRCIRTAMSVQQQCADTTRAFDLDQDYLPNEPVISNAAHGAVMCDVFRRLCMLVSVHGCPVFEPQEDVDPAPPPEIHLCDSTAGETFYCRSDLGANATGVWKGDRFVVREGSVARPDVAPHAVETLGRRRKQLIDEGILATDGDKLRFARDCEFRSVSGAAAVVLGRAADGFLEWEDKDGKSLGEIMRPGGGDQ